MGHPWRGPGFVVSGKDESIAPCSVAGSGRIEFPRTRFRGVSELIWEGIRPAPLTKTLMTAQCGVKFFVIHTVSCGLAGEWLHQDLSLLSKFEGEH